ncbi:MAG: hypothetical protein AAGA66_07555 [Bacteroidota bacterium]
MKVLFTLITLFLVVWQLKAQDRIKSNITYPATKTVFVNAGDVEARLSLSPLSDYTVTGDIQSSTCQGGSADGGDVVSYCGIRTVNNNQYNVSITDVDQAYASYFSVSGSEVIFNSNVGAALPQSITLRVKITESWDLKQQQRLCTSVSGGAAYCGSWSTYEWFATDKTYTNTMLLTFTFEHSVDISANQISISPETHYCERDEGGVTLSVKPGAYEPTTAYRLYRSSDGNASDFVGFFSNGTYVIPHAELGTFKPGRSNEYQFFVTAQEQNALEQNDPAVKELEIRDLQQVPLISGPVDVCQGDWSQVYDYTYADSYDAVQWSCEGCSAAASSSDSYTVTWDPSASTHRIAAYVTRDGCATPTAYYDVAVETAINTDYSIGSGTIEQCAGSSFTLTLNDSQTGKGSYVLFRNGNEVSGSMQSGTGEPLSWSVTSTGTYTVKLRTPGCGDYSMSGSTATAYFPESPAPEIRGILEYCSGSTVVLDAQTNQFNDGWTWDYYNGSAWNSVTGQETSYFSSALPDQTTAIRAYYRDVNGCPSQMQEVAVSFVVLPSNHTITGPTDLCVHDYLQEYTVSGGSPDRWNWRAAGGDIVSGQGSTKVTVQWSGEELSPTLYTQGVTDAEEGACAGPEASFTVTLRNDIVFPDMIGSFICQEDLGTVGLDGSQEDLLYFLFNAAGEQIGNTVVGSGKPLSFDGLTAGTYEIRVQHPGECGFYSMGTADVIAYSKREKPVITSNTIFCGEATYGMRVNSPFESNGYVYYEEVDGILERMEGETKEEVQLSLEEGKVYYAGYIDDRGCESELLLMEYTLLEIPDIVFEPNAYLCIDDRDVDFDGYLESNTPGGFWISDYTNAFGKLDATLLPESVHGTFLEAEYIYESPATGCTARGLLSVFVEPDPFVLEKERFGVCFDAGSVDLSDNVVSHYPGATFTYEVAGKEIAGTSILFQEGGYSPGSYTVKVTPDERCQTTKTFELVVEDHNEALAIPASALTFCSYFETIDLSSLVSNREGRFFLNQVEVPAQVTQATEGWVYGNNDFRFIDGNECSIEHLFTLVIDPPATIDFSGFPGKICAADGNVPLEDLMQPAGGTLTGNFVNGQGAFVASAAGPGSHTVTYTLTVNACLFTADHTFEVDASPVVFAGASEQRVCRNEIHDLSGAENVTGTWGGHPSIQSDGKIDGSLIEEGVSFVDAMFTHINAAGCSGSDVVRVFVDALSVIDVNVREYVLCVNDDPIDVRQDISQNDVIITASAGVSAGILYPGIMGVGNHELMVSRESDQGCINQVTIPVTIVDTEPLELIDTQFCVGTGEADLYAFTNVTGGTYLHENVQDGRYFNLDTEAGTYVIPYEVEGSGNCSLSGDLMVTVNALPEAVEVTPAVVTCYSDESVTLEVINASVRYEYSWFDADTDQFLGQGDHLTVANEVRSYVVEAMSDKGCITPSAPTDVVIQDFEGSILVSPFVNEQVISGEVVNFSTDIVADDYWWQLTQYTAQTGASTPMVFNYADTTLTVTLEVSTGGCVKAFGKELRVVDVYGHYTIDEKDAADENELSFVTDNQTEILLFPNPATGPTVTIAVKSLSPEKMKIRLFNSVHQQVSEQLVELETGNNHVEITLPETLNGIYFIQLLSPTVRQFITGIK